MVDEVKEPAEGFTFLEHEYNTWGSSTGRAKTDDYDKGKFNRYAKLGKVSDSVTNDLIAKVNKDPESVDGKCAYASLLMMLYGVRIGNEGSAEGYASGLDKNKGEIVKTYGTTTLLHDHIEFKNNTMLLAFLGKEQVQHNIEISEPFLVKLGKLYWNKSKPSNKWIGIEYETLFKFVKKKIGKSFIPKDLRTFCANITGWNQIKQYMEKPKSSSKKDINKEVAEIVETVAERLGNTPSVARSRYLDSRMLNWYKSQRLEEEDGKKTETE